MNSEDKARAKTFRERRSVKCVWQPDRFKRMVGTPIYWSHRPTTDNVWERGERNVKW